jgi:hypothetical protein
MSNRPTHRVSYYCKTEKKSYDVAAVFPDDRHDWKQNVSPEKRADMSAQYPKMLLSEAALRCERGEGYISITRPKNQPPADDRAKSNSDFGGDDFGGDDLPF